MPYIKPDLREAIDAPLKDAAQEIVTIGALTFAFTQLATRYITLRGLSYDTLATVLGALEATKLELYRRVGAPYENTKKAVNGDISGYVAIDRQIVPLIPGPFVVKRDSVYEYDEKEKGY